MPEHGKRRILRREIEKSSTLAYVAQFVRDGMINEPDHTKDDKAQNNK